MWHVYCIVQFISIYSLRELLSLLLIAHHLSWGLPSASQVGSTLTRSCGCYLRFHLLLALSSVSVLLGRFWRLVVGNFISLWGLIIIHLVLLLFRIWLVRVYLVILHQILDLLVCKLLKVTLISLFVVSKLMVLGEWVRYIDLVGISIKPNLLSKRPREHECLGCVLFNFLVDLLFEVNQLFFNFVVYMPLVFKEVFWEVLFLLLLIVDVLT
jgi:hypothetical protein